jgi:hypothetical protein
MAHIKLADIIHLQEMLVVASPHIQTLLSRTQVVHCYRLENALSKNCSSSLDFHYFCS